MTCNLKYNNFKVFSRIQHADGDLLNFFLKIKILSQVVT
jgi:hypothetical protein